MVSLLDSVSHENLYPKHQGVTLKLKVDSIIQSFWTKQAFHGCVLFSVRVFQWKQLENLYFRDKKFSIEVHDKPSVVQTLSSFNLYEDALKLDAASQKDALVDAIADSTTQVSVSRR